MPEVNANYLLSQHSLLHPDDRGRVVASNPHEILWHFSDTSDPESIIVNGFTARNSAARISIRRWSSEMIPAQFVSTTRNRHLSRDFPVYMDRRYRFKITSAHNIDPVGVDVNATLGRAAKFQDEQEIAFLGRIAPQAIASVYDEALDRTGRWDASRNSVEWVAGEWQNPHGPDRYLAGEKVAVSGRSSELLQNSAHRNRLEGFASAVLQASRNGPVTVYVDDPKTRAGLGGTFPTESALRAIISERRADFGREIYPISFEAASQGGATRTRGIDQLGEHSAWMSTRLHPDQHVGSRLGFFLKGNMLVDSAHMEELLSLHSRIGGDVRGLDSRFSSKVGKNLKTSINDASEDGLLDRREAYNLARIVDNGYRRATSVPMSTAAALAPAGSTAHTGRPSQHAAQAYTPAATGTSANRR
ncbi:hypothetical protein [Streptomyces sp. NPDC088847]|uniref:scabin-related ADP-ribosyltransferase n=1 Tax=Streptomyces sp. NPDC088847 TaxID=3365909 RepID=UPI003814C521